jgi:outer membrane immunogenic protein
MRKTVLGAVAVAMFATSAATAADIPRPYAQPYMAVAPVVFGWTGPYIGVNVGYQWADVTRSVFEPQGVMGGAQAGYNWQFGSFMVGAETDLQVSGADDVFAPYKFSNPWFGTVRARAGLALNNVLLYGTGGFAYGEGKLSAFGLSEMHTQMGWAAGVGIEVGFTRNWSAKAEYMFVDLSDRPYILTGARNGIESHIVRLGVNYHF